jgi:hypothetical protein
MSVDVRKASHGLTEAPSWSTDPIMYTNLLMHHPLITGKTLIPTEPVAAFCRKVHTGVILRQQGLCFTAVSGTGKTSALHFVKDYLETQIPRLVVYSHSTQNVQVSSIRAFFKGFLNSINTDDLNGETPNLRKRVVKKIEDDAMASGHGMAVLLIDEAHVMKMNDFYFLKDTMNALDKVQIGLVTVLMAQSPEFDGVYNAMKEANKLDLFARFALYRTPFQSLRTFNDLKKIFEHIDNAEYSADFPVKWTEFFFPIAYSWGFRLADEAKKFFDIFVRLCSEWDVPVEFPARQAFYVLRAFLANTASFDSRDMVVPDEVWSNAIREGKMTEALAVSNQKPASASLKAT